MKTISITKADYIQMQTNNSVVVDNKLVYIANDKTFRYCNLLKGTDNAGHPFLGKSYECRIKY